MSNTHRMKTKWMLAGFLFPAMFAAAQQPPCHFDEQRINYSLIHPDVIKRWLDAEDRAEHSTVSGARIQSLITIPVVVHVVYHTTAENISTAQVQSQLDVLNEDYRRRNADTASTRFVFKPFAGDAMIEFCLAQRDPNGDSTDGITRTYTSRTDWGCCDSMKRTAYGGQDGWPGNQYLNIWVCNLNFANGYAYYPGTPDPDDGVVVHYYVFGRTGNVAPGYIGRTGTHEVGHYLGLYHTFEYGQCSGTDTSNCAAAGDRVCDTPADDAPDYGCLLGANDCIDVPVNRPDQVENYLDYSDDNCRNMFSLGQIARMRGFLFTSRSSLLTSLGCVPPASTWMDAAAIKIVQPLAQVCDTVVTVQVEIGNISAMPLTAVDADYWFDAGPVNTFHSAMPVAPGGISFITLPPVNLSFGNHRVNVALHSPNGSIDHQPGNDSAAYSFRILSVNDGHVLPLTEGFEGSAFAPADWLIDNPDEDKAWLRFNDSAGGGFGMSHSAALFQNFYNGATHTHDGLITPACDFRSAANPAMAFDVAYCDPLSTFYSDTLKVYSSADCGQTWNLLWAKGGAALATAPAPVVFSEFVPDSSQWRRETISLSSLSGNPLVTFKFENVSYWGNDLYLDNINISSATGIDEPGAALNMHVFPNPSTGIVTIESAGSPISAIVVFNSMGEKIFSENHLSVYSRELNLRQYPGGVYSIHVNSESKVWSTTIVLL